VRRAAGAVQSPHQCRGDRAGAAARAAAPQERGRAPLGQGAVGLPHLGGPGAAAQAQRAQRVHDRARLPP